MGVKETERRNKKGQNLRTLINPGKSVYDENALEYFGGEVAVSTKEKTIKTTENVAVVKMTTPIVVPRT